MSDPILVEAEKCLAAWEALIASGQRQPVPLYCTEHDEWERQHNKVAGAWRDALCDLLATVPTTRQGAIALIDAFLLYPEADMHRTQCSELLARLKAFLQSAAYALKKRAAWPDAQDRPRYSMGCLCAAITAIAPAVSRYSPQSSTRGRPVACRALCSRFRSAFENVCSG